MLLTVSELAGRAGISPDAVRYYGRLGLLPETGRTDAGHRYYDEAALERLRFIKGAQWFELRLEEIRELLDVVDGQECACGHTRAVVLRRIAAIDEQQARLEEIRAALCRLLDGAPGHGPGVPGHKTKHGHETKGSTTMPDTLTDDAEATVATDPGCGCCKPPEPTTVADEVRELQARREAVERRLAGIQGAGR